MKLIDVDNECIHGLVWNSNRASVMASVDKLVWNSVRHLVCTSVLNTIMRSVDETVWGSVKISVYNVINLIKVDDETE